MKKTNRTLPELLSEAQTVFNKWIRNRDKDKGCISCNGPVEQAGHYFSQGQHSALRFNEMNVNGQCVRCNYYLHANLINYRRGLVSKYGAEAVEQLEASAVKRVRKWSRFELEWILTTYTLIKRR